MLTLSQKKEKTNLICSSSLYVLVGLTFLKYLVVLQASEVLSNLLQSLDAVC